MMKLDAGKKFQQFWPNLKLHVRKNFYCSKAHGSSIFSWRLQVIAIKLQSINWQSETGTQVEKAIFCNS